MEKKTTKTAKPKEEVKKEEVKEPRRVIIIDL